MTFIPYSYRRSTSATYVPPGGDPASPVDCTKSDAQCYGGAAKHLAPDFPKSIGIIYLPNELQLDTPSTKTETLKSSYSSEGYSNRHSVNDMDAAKVGNTYGSADLGSFGDGYVANSYRDYVWACRDDWYDPETYTITLKISEEDSEPGNPTVNHIGTWKELP
ncbi:MAG: hypothetical protein HC902_01515 [Calothrix sp. SM1_5_4]|nr:hypothetical protein [Calothrix sp. SM1_5_4]